MDTFRRSALTYFAGAAAATTLEQLILGFATVAEAGGFSAAACFHVARPGQPISVRLLFDWRLSPGMQAQISRRLSRQDEVVRALFMSASPIRWSDLDIPEATSLRGDDAAQSAFDGLVVPVHGPLGETMCVVIVGPDVTVISPTLRMTLQMAATLLANHGASLVEIEAEAASGDGPSPREAQCASLAGEGKSDWEIGRILGVSEDVVAFHMERLKTKLGVSNRVEIPANAWLDTKRQDE